MLTQLQLEGPDLETLLARVRNELGTSARIVHAEKIRSGGVAGFFARERFELTVEVDTDAHRAFTAAQSAVAARSGAVTPGPGADTGSRPVAPAQTRTGEPAAVPAAPVPAAAAPAPAAAAPVPAPAAPLAAVRPPAAPPVPAQRTASHSELATLLPNPDDSLFSTILGLGGTADGAGGTPPAAPDEAFQALLASPPARTTPPSSSVLRGAAAAAAASAYRPLSEIGLNPAAAVLAAEEAAAAIVPGPALPGPDPVTVGAAASTGAPRTLLELAAQASEDERTTVSTESPSFASLLDGLSDAMGTDAPPSTPPSAPVIEGSATPPSAAPVQAPAPVPVQAAVAPVAPAPTAAPAAPEPAAGDLAVRPSADLPVPAAAAQEESAHEQDTTGVELARLGLPVHLRPATVGAQLHTALRASLTRLPTAPPAVNRAGGVLAIVGPLALALHVAREVAEELGLPVATSVAVATSGDASSEVPERQVLHGAAEAAERRATWRRRSNLTVVAVDAPLTATGAAEARAFLSALSPSATWGAVEATRKAQDVGAWTRALGGVHALALTDVEDTADPAAVLELGIPVSRLGGRPATPRAWATLLTGRLAA